MLSDQHSLFRATGLATSQLFHPALFLSFLSVLLQVVFSLPLALRPSGVHPNAVKQSFAPSFLSMCPNQFHLLRRASQLMSLTSAISSTVFCSRFVISLLPPPSLFIVAPRYTNSSTSSTSSPLTTDVLLTMSKRSPLSVSYTFLHYV